MRVYPVRAQISPRIITKNDKLKSNNPIIPVTTESRPIQGSGVILTFTGNDKNIHQFASYAPENKRYGVKPYNLGGLGVVAQEAPENWRLKEGADVRDFSPYHSFNNGDGGITVAKLTKDNNGKYNEHYPAENFISAKQNRGGKFRIRNVRCGSAERGVLRKAIFAEILSPECWKLKINPYICTTKTEACFLWHGRIRSSAGRAQHF